MHAVGAGIVVKLHRLPLLRAIFRGNEVVDGAIFQGLPKIPLPAHGDLAFAITVDIAGGDADIIAKRQLFSDNVFFPTRILIPLHGGLVGEKDIDVLVTINVSQRESVANLNLVDFLFAPAKFRRLCIGKAGKKNENGAERKSKQAIHDA